MFEAVVSQGVVWKKIVEAVKELVSDVNLQTTNAGIGIQAMDSAHVALVSLSLRAKPFAHFQCERSALLGLSLTSLSKILKATENTDQITLRHIDDSDVLSVLSESEDKSKMSEFQLKLMEIDAETMTIPDMDYETSVSLSSAEFAKICKDMSVFGDTVTIAVTRDGVKFAATSDMGEGFIFLRSGAAADSVKREVKRESTVKSESGVKREITDDEPLAPAVSAAAATTTTTKKGAKEDAAEPVQIEMDSPITLSFALRYFTIFSKASTLSSRVTLKLAMDAPCMVEFEVMGLGHLRFYLAPKVEED